MIRLADDEENILQDILNTLSEKTSVQAINVTPPPEERHRLVFSDLEIKLKDRELYDIEIDPLEAIGVKEIFDIADRSGHGGRRISSQKPNISAAWR